MNKKTIFWDICKYLGNRCNTFVRNAKSVYINTSLQRTVDDPRKFWKSINILLKGPKKDIVVHEFIDSVTGNTIEQDSVCDYLNKFYVNVGKDNFTIVTPRPHWNVQDIGHDFEPVTTAEVKRLVRDIDIGKDSCIEGVSSSILKDSFFTVVKSSAIYV